MSRRSGQLSEEIHGEGAREAVFQHPWMSGPAPRWSVLSRSLNILGALALIIVLAPLVLVVALILRVRQGPGVLTRERRLGLHSVVFDQWLFRVSDRSCLAISDASGLQNLPAVLNVLSGDMTIVGPRPVCPKVARREAERDPFYTSRFSVRPGLLNLEG